MRGPAGRAWADDRRWRLGTMAMLYAATVWLALTLSIGSEGLVAIWLANGVALAALLASPRSDWRMLLGIVLLISLISNALAGVPLAANAGLALLATLEPAGAAWWLGRGRSERITFARMNEVLALAGAAAAVTVIAAIVTLPVPWLGNGESLWNIWVTGRLADGLGMLIVTPFIITWLWDDSRLERAWLGLLGGAALYALWKLSAWEWSLPGSPGVIMLLGALITFPLLIWAALRLGPRGTALVLLVLHTNTLWSTVRAGGLFDWVGLSPTAHLLAAQVYAGVVSLTGLVLAAVVAERARALVSLRESEATYRRMFGEHLAVALLLDPDTGAIVDANAAASEFYGYPVDVLRGMNIGALNILSREQIAAHMQEAQGQTRNMFLFRHRLASGDVRDVEVYSSPIQVQGRCRLYSIIHDVTERRRAEEAYRVLVEGSLQGLVIFSDNRIAFANQAFGDMVGYSVSELLEAREEEILQRVSPGDRDRMAQPDATRRRDGRPEPHLEISVRHRDGSLCWLQVSTSEIAFGGRPALQAVFIDKTLRKQAEEELRVSAEALRRSEELFSKAFHSSPAAFAITRAADGRILDVNDSLSGLTGYARAELLGHTSIELGIITPEQRGQLLQVIERERGTVRSLELVLATKLRAPRTVLASVERLCLEQGPCLLFSFHDITERKQLEMELQAQRDFALQVMNTMGQGLVVTDERFHFQFVNPAFAQITGYAAHELVRIARLDAVFVEDQVTWQQARALRLENKASTYQARLRRKDGSTIQVLITGVPRWSDGGFAGDIVVVTDLTEQKRVEERLEYLGTHDALTGLYNYAFFQAELARLEASRRLPISIVVLDLDDLKSVNDGLGHSAGNELLRRSARVLRSSFRAADIVARVGGDEFAVILPATDDVTAAQIVTRLREQVAAFNRGRPDLPVSLSIGIATAIEGGLAQTFRAADVEMYMEKRAHKLASEARMPGDGGT